MTGHGFRSMGLTVGTETLDFKFDVIDRQLSHVPKGETRQAYDRAKHLTQRKKFMQAYSNYLESFINHKHNRGNHEQPNYYFQPYTATDTTFKFFGRNESFKQYQSLKSQQRYKVGKVPNAQEKWAIKSLDGSANSGLYK